MGILDKKTRFIDLIITEEGKRQLSEGGLSPAFASLSDCFSFYEENEDPSTRIYFEATSRPEDLIIYQKKDNGKLFSKIDSSFSVIGDKIFEQNGSAEDINKITAVTGSQFQSFLTGSLPKSIIDSFKNNYFLKSNLEDRDNEFQLSKSTIDFTITNTAPFKSGPLQETINVNDAEPFFLDPHLTYFKSFDFLPPVNTDNSPYGVYKDIRSKTKETWEQIKEKIGPNSFLKETLDDEAVSMQNSLNSEVMNLLEDGKLPLGNYKNNIQNETIKFLKTSKNNNFILQIFESGQGENLTKLDIIDAGSFVDSNDPNNRYEKRVFYVGKVYYDDLNIPTYINMFTIVMD